MRTQIGGDRLATISAHAVPLARRILDAYEAREGSRIVAHFDRWVAANLESGGRPPLSPVERRLLFFRVTHTAENKARVIPGKNSEPDRWTGVAEHGPAIAGPAERRIIAEPSDAQE